MNNATNSSSNSTYEGWQAQQAPKSFWTNLTLPILYLTILIGSLYTFSSLYRKRQISAAAKLENWFPPHRQRDVYLSLLHLDPAEASESADGGEKKLKQVPDSVLKAALLRRALEDIQRIVQLRGAKPALQTLLQRGSVGDELWQRFSRAEKELEEEIKDVVNEANAFAPNWGQTIFQSANEINQNNLLKERVAEIQAQLDAEKAWWENRRAGIQSDFMKELETDGKPAEAAPRKTGSSDEDTVLVEAGGPAQQQGTVKKKKGKK
ncbi:Translocation protein S66 [Vermiconidia calcicola]|uniref:Translocation protein S66 n=1 Tax=Vermiconidia calcicola TaxID=1690605 RepID=A0ACC3NLL9_9PEZI|nr:Translocation protein S66 [Vermiconidia calcicola]